MSYEFKPGEYKTRDGRKAIVEFIVRKPTTEIWVLAGQLCYNGLWQRVSWRADGAYWGKSEAPADLMPPTTTKWCCIRHNGAVSQFFRDKKDFVITHDVAHYISAEFDADGCIIPNTIWLGAGEKP